MKLFGGDKKVLIFGGLGQSGYNYFADGTAAAPSMTFANDTNSGFYLAGSDSIGVAVGGVSSFVFQGTAGSLRAAAASLALGTTDNGTMLTLANTGAIDLAAAGTNQNITLTPSGTGRVIIGGGSIRSATGTSLALGTVDGGTALTLDTSNNATGVGYAQGWQQRVQAKTQAASPYSVSATTDNRNAFTNEGTTALVTFNLPTAAANLVYEFVVQDTDGIRVVANTGDTIRLAGSVSAAAGRIDSTTIGSTVRLLAINATEWVATAINGTWTVT
jgi:hypothetical protein